MPPGGVHDAYSVHYCVRGSRDDKKKCLRKDIPGTSSHDIVYTLFKTEKKWGGPGSGRKKR